ncbi:hypothetical protein AAVH_28854, partial [Aphelenchoides avenae]
MAAITGSGNTWKDYGNAVPEAESWMPQLSKRGNRCGQMMKMYDFLKMMPVADRLGVFRNCWSGDVTVLK